MTQKFKTFFNQSTGNVFDIAQIIQNTGLTRPTIKTYMGNLTQAGYAVRVSKRGPGLIAQYKFAKPIMSHHCYSRSKKYLLKKVSSTCVKIEEKEQQNKEFVESSFIRICEDYLGPEKVEALTISGLEYDRHVKKLMNNLCSSVTILENNPDNFLKIVEKASKCSFYHINQINLIKMDAENLKFSGQYMDLDLMATLSTIKHILISSLKNQASDYTKNKAFIFTCSDRRQETLQIFVQDLNEIFDSIGLMISGFDNKPDGFGSGICLSVKSDKCAHYCIEHNMDIISKGRSILTKCFSYGDNTPMFTCMIIYK
jgi:hypothetical protein